MALQSRMGTDARFKVDESFMEEEEEEGAEKDEGRVGEKMETSDTGES